MKHPWLAGILVVAFFNVQANDVPSAILVVAFFNVQANDVPSAVMREIPPIPDPVRAEDCDAMTPVLANVEQLARADMMHAQQLAMRGARSGAVSNKQGGLIARLMDPSVTQCEMQVAQTHAGKDATVRFKAALGEIHSETRDTIESSCPVTGMGDSREESCVDPIRQRGMQKERDAISAYIARANAALSGEVETYAQCAVKREQLAKEVEGAGLPVQYVSIAFNGKVMGWRQVGALANRYQQLCGAAARASSDLQERERNW